MSTTRINRAVIPQAEAEFLEQVRNLARLNAWRVYHTWMSIRSEPGFPDLVLCRPPRLIFAELKRPNGQLTEPQRQWLDLLGQCEVETYLWRPSDWDEIVRTLARR